MKMMTAMIPTRAETVGTLPNGYARSVPLPHYGQTVIARGTDTLSDHRATHLSKPSHIRELAALHLSNTIDYINSLIN
jgi:hypothetical protein